MREKEPWSTPYAKAGGAHSLSGPALVEMARELLSRGHSFRFFAPGASMSPFIRDGDTITLAPFAAAACGSGDVVAVIRPGSGRLVVHRVVWIDGDRCRIRGDNNPAEDGDLPFESVIGTVTQVERAGKTVRLGLGPERALIALMSRRGWLPGCISVATTVFSAVRRVQ